MIHVGRRLFVLASMSVLIACSRTDRANDKGPPAVSDPAATPAPSANLVKLPGPCVDPSADALKREGLQASDPELAGKFGEAVDKLDLDLDGTNDRAFAVGGGVVMARHLYVVRGACAHWVGALGSNGFKPLTTRHAGLVDLEAVDTRHCEGDPGPCKEIKSTWVFDGVEYKPKK